MMFVFHKGVQQPGRRLLRAVIRWMLLLVHVSVSCSPQGYLIGEIRNYYGVTVWCQPHDFPRGCYCENGLRIPIYRGSKSQAEGASSHLNLIAAGPDRPRTVA